MSLVSDVVSAVRLFAGKDSTQAVKMYSDDSIRAYCNQITRMVTAELVKRESPIIHKISSITITASTQAHSMGSYAGDFYGLVSQECCWVSGDAESPLIYAPRRYIASLDTAQDEPTHFSVSWPTTGSYATLHTGPPTSANTSVQLLYYAIPDMATTTTDRLPFGELFTALYVQGSQMFAANAAEAKANFEMQIVTAVADSVDQAVMQADPYPKTIYDGTNLSDMEA